ncbi:GAF and ANTAR domain-containing protein [Lentzea sp.]|uniref:GAF and ANTAR domain-containing protein n=1 Tax=Lentzea sp. TaxID=56099 RepID=UPI002CA5091A|nr:GAF and ANTAR domain-containing protein [Lentzea sp.]HUQ56349.1 GAF and ANTAR domain-containing protein [Lentzea sp.]
MDDQRRDRLTRLVAECGTEPDRSALGRALCAAFLHVLPGADGAALVLHGSGWAQELVGASDTWSARLTEAQYTLGEGPGAEAAGTGQQVLAGDLSSEAVRWPAFASAAEADGLSSVFVFPLRVGAIVLGTVALYGRRAHHLSGEAVADAALLADLVTHALLAQNERAGDEEQLRMDVSYHEVNMATGMLAAQLRVSLEDAFLRLRAHSFAAGRSVLDVAKDVLARRIPLDQLVD